MSLEEEVRAAFEAARAFATEGEVVTGVLPTESGGIRLYLCSYELGEERSWLALDDDGDPIQDRALVREAVSIAALCELAEDCAGGGDIGELRTRLVELRLTEKPEGIEEAEVAAAGLQESILAEPRIASVGYLDAIGLAANKFEASIGEIGASPFAEAMKAAIPAADELARTIERSYKLSLR